MKQRCFNDFPTSIYRLWYKKLLLEMIEIRKPKVQLWLDNRLHGRWQVTALKVRFDLLKNKQTKKYLWKHAICIHLTKNVEPGQFTTQQMWKPKDEACKAWAFWWRQNKIQSSVDPWWTLTMWDNDAGFVGHSGCWATYHVYMHTLRFTSFIYLPWKMKDGICDFRNRSQQLFNETVQDP